VFTYCGKKVKRGNTKAFMVMQHAHLGASHLAEFADNVPRFRLVAGKKLAALETDSADNAASL
jgi:hypothetical protein